MLSSDFFKISLSVCLLFFFGCFIYGDELRLVQIFYEEAWKMGTSKEERDILCSRITRRLKAVLE